MLRSNSIQTDPYAHLYGKVDPSDGIPYRRAEAVEVQRGGAGPWPPLTHRCIYRKGSRWRVRIRVNWMLRSIGYFKTLREAQRARDQFWESLYGTEWQTRMRGTQPKNSTKKPKGSA